MPHIDLHELDSLPLDLVKAIRSRPDVTWECSGKATFYELVQKFGLRALPFLPYLDNVIQPFRCRAAAARLYLQLTPYFPSSMTEDVLAFTDYVIHFDRDAGERAAWSLDAMLKTPKQPTSIKTLLVCARTLLEYDPQVAFRETAYQLCHGCIAETVSDLVGFDINAVQSRLNDNVLRELENLALILHISNQQNYHASTAPAASG